MEYTRIIIAVMLLVTFVSHADAYQKPCSYLSPQKYYRDAAGKCILKEKSVITSPKTTHDFYKDTIKSYKDKRKQLIAELQPLVDRRDQIIEELKYIDDVLRKLQTSSPVSYKIQPTETII
jgi:hypothetical protein